MVWSLWIAGMGTALRGRWEEARWAGSSTTPCAADEDGGCHQAGTEVSRGAGSQAEYCELGHLLGCTEVQVG